MDKTLRERAEAVDTLLFEAGVLILDARTVAGRHAADRKITDARVALEQLRSRLT
jgi:hypothetical protein